MDKIQSGKVLVGSTLRKLDVARKSGKICPKELMLLHIINELSNTCELNKSFEIQKVLNERAIILQNKHDSICSYRERKGDKVFIAGKKETNFNSVGKAVHKIVANDNFTSIMDNNIYNFTALDFTLGINLKPNTNYGVVIASLPSLGLLVYNSNPISIGEMFPLTSLISNNLQFIPNDIDVNYLISFNFQIIIIP